MFEVEDRGIIYDATQADVNAKIAYFTALCPLKSGTLLCSFQNGPSKHSAIATLGLCRSTDGGTTWTKLSKQFETTIDGIPGSLAGGEMVEAEPGRVLMFATWFDRSDPTRPLFNPVTEGILRSKQLLAISHDEGTTWSDWQEIPTPGLAGCALTGPCVRWDDGMIAFPFESFKEFDDPRPGYHAAWIIVTRDGGRTFSKPLLVAQDPAHKTYYWDQRLCTTGGPGEFIALFWTHDLAQQKDLTVHLRRATIQGDSITDSPIYTLPIVGQIAAPLFLPDGRLLAFVVDRGNPGTLTLWSSPDAGTTWPSDERFVVHVHDERALLSQGKDNIDFKQYWEDMGKWSFGHPAIRPLDNGRILLAHYAGSPDCMSLHWVRVRCR